MPYLQYTGRKSRPGAIAGVVAVHAAIGYALVNGLSFSVLVEQVRNPKGIFVPEVTLPPPPPPESEQRPVEATVDRPIVVPQPKTDVSPIEPVIDTSPVIIPTPDVIPYTVPRPTPSATPARPTLDPIAAKPRGNPGGWVTVDDYRSNWINREMTGTARFRLEIGPSGRVEKCTITASSGFAELDRATCALVSQRARFEPARDGNDATVPGSYANSVRWELPE